MPLYDVQCKRCLQQWEIFKKIKEPTPRCQCGGFTEVVLNTKGRDWFTPHWNEHLGDKPIFIESKKQYRQECEKRGLQARCLM